MIFCIGIANVAISEDVLDRFIYDSHGKRDPFIPLVGSSHLRGSGLAEIASIDDVDFQGVASDAKRQRIIIINGEMLRVGDELDALTVKRITENGAVVVIRDKEYRLTLYEQGG